MIFRFSFYWFIINTKRKSHRELRFGLIRCNLLVEVPKRLPLHEPSQVTRNMESWGRYIIQDVLWFNGLPCKNRKVEGLWCMFAVIVKVCIIYCPNWLWFLQFCCWWPFRWIHLFLRYGQSARVQFHRCDSQLLLYFVFIEYVGKVCKEMEHS